MAQAPGPDRRILDQRRPFTETRMPGRGIEVRRQALVPGRRLGRLDVSEHAVHVPEPDAAPVEMFRRAGELGACRFQPGTEPVHVAFPGAEAHMVEAFPLALDEHHLILIAPGAAADDHAVALGGFQSEVIEEFPADLQVRHGLGVILQVPDGHGILPESRD